MKVLLDVVGIVLYEFVGCGPALASDPVPTGSTLVDISVAILRKVFVVESSEAVVDIAPLGSPLPVATVELAKSEVTLPTSPPPV